MLGVLGMMFAACDDAPEAPKPQENPQEPIFSVNDLVSEKAGVLASNAVLNLEDYRESTGIPVMKLDSAKNLPAGAEVLYKLKVSNEEDSSRGKVVTLTATAGEDSIYYVDPIEWNNAHVSLFGKSPKVKDLHYAVAAYVKVDGSEYSYVSDTYYVAAGVLEETCMDLGFVIESNYYLIGNLNNWALDKAMPFSHSDNDVYDDPMFVVTFKVTQDILNANGGGCYWKIAPESSVTDQNWDTVLGPETNGDSSLTGLLVDTNAQAGEITESGNYKMTINMEAMTYTIEKLLRPEYVYTPGGTNGWSQVNSAWMQYLAHDDFTGYYALMPVNGEGFKACLDTKWDNSTDYGSASDDPADSGTFVLGQEGKNIKATAAGLYWFSALYDEDLGVLTTYTLAPITRVGIIGSFTASGWARDIAMTGNEDLTVWTADVELQEGTEWKIRFNNDWVYDFGYNTDHPGYGAYKGGNFSVETTGTYTITLTLQPGLPKITCELK